MPDIEYRKQLRSAFRKTTLAIWVIPIIVNSVFPFVFGGLATYIANQDIPETDGPFATRPILYQSYFAMESDEWVEIYGILGQVLCEWMVKVLTIGAIYWIWVRSNTKQKRNQKIE